MKFLIFWLCFCSYLSLCLCQDNVSESVGGWRGVLTECGQSLTAHSGVIEYKLNQTYEAGEICTFILRHNYSEYGNFRFVLESHGISGFDPNALTITTLFVGQRENLNYSRAYVASSISLGPPSLIPVANIYGLVAVVIFKPNSNSGTGFRLSYKVTDLMNGAHRLEIGGSDLVLKEETASPIFDPLMSGCPQEYCANMLILTSSNMLIVDPEYNLKLTMSSKAEDSDVARGAFYQIYDYQDTAINDLGRYYAYNPNLNTTYSRKDFFTRGIFILTYTHGWKGPQNVTIGWGKSPDPEM